MSASLTAENKRVLKWLLRTGRWGNESEIIRAAIHLLAKQVEAELERTWPEPIPDHVMDRIYREETEEERELERKAARASRRHKPEPIE